MTRQSDSNTSKRDWLILTCAIIVASICYFVFKQSINQPPNQKKDNPTSSNVPSAVMDGAMTMLKDFPSDYSSLVSLGNRLMDEGNYPVAAECYKRALALQDDSPDVRVDYGACLHGMGLSRRAIEEFRRIIELNPTHAIAHFNLGIVYYDLNEIDSAQVYWQKYLIIDPDGQAARAAWDLLRETSN